MLAFEMVPFDPPFVMPSSDLPFLSMLPYRSGRFLGPCVAHRLR